MFEIFIPTSGGGFGYYYWNQTNYVPSIVYEEYGQYSLGSTSDFAPIAGATVTVTDGSGGVLATGQTDSNGDVQFTIPTNVVYIITVTSPGLPTYTSPEYLNNNNAYGQCLDIPALVVMTPPANTMCLQTPSGYSVTSIPEVLDFTDPLGTWALPILPPNIQPSATVLPATFDYSQFGAVQGAADGATYWQVAHWSGVFLSGVTTSTRTVNTSWDCPPDYPSTYSVDQQQYMVNYNVMLFNSGAAYAYLTIIRNGAVSTGFCTFRLLTLTDAAATWFPLFQCNKYAGYDGCFNPIDGSDAGNFSSITDGCNCEYAGPAEGTLNPAGFPYSTTQTLNYEVYTNQLEDKIPAAPKGYLNIPRNYAAFSSDITTHPLTISFNSQDLIGFHGNGTYDTYLQGDVCYLLDALSLFYDVYMTDCTSIVLTATGSN